MEVSGQLHALSALSPEKYPPVPTGWVPEPVWMLWSREKNLNPAVNRTLVVQPVTRRYTGWAMSAIYYSGTFLIIKILIAFNMDVYTYTFLSHRVMIGVIVPIEFVLLSKWYQLPYFIFVCLHVCFVFFLFSRLLYNSPFYCWVNM
jgi:hypothetical protein